MGQWLYYNFAAGSFHKNKLVADFVRRKLNFIFKKRKIAFEPPFGDLGVTYALHL